jgi:hypothetical protein
MERFTTGDFILFSRLLVASRSRLTAASVYFTAKYADSVAMNYVLMHANNLGKYEG